jgi:hypothetical protein
VSGGFEVAYSECNRCGARAAALFSTGRSMFWAGQGTCEHAPHERPALDDPRVRRALAKTHKDGQPASLRVNPADALSTPRSARCSPSTPPPAPASRSTSTASWPGRPTACC